MFRRAACAAFILYQFVWLAAVVPGHTRGRFTLPGTKGSCNQESGHGCCPGARAKSPQESGDKEPTPADRARCAVCYFAAGLSTPVAFCYDFAPSGVQSVRAELPPPAFDPTYTPAYYGRDPPVA